MNRKRIYEILSNNRENDTLSKGFGIFIVTLIGLNVIALILESVTSIHNKAPEIFRIFEYISVIIFTIEYILRIWSCVENPKYASPVKGRLRFSATPMALIDLLAILPFYLPFTGIDLRFLRILRMMRIMRIAKLGRYSQSIQTLNQVISAKKEQLICIVFILFLLLIISSSLLYYTENEAQPDKFSSIPASMWWAITTLTTVGYGDMCPVTAFGKVLAAIIAVLGIGMFALPTGVIGAGFMEEINQNPKTMTCPHCGKEIQS
ncbi:MAG: ion transporter [Sedimentisphaerales bacterium]|nr:ion transporter [Sedimentisphaerales bacterium]